MSSFSGLPNLKWLNEKDDGKSYYDSEVPLMIGVNYTDD
jgi:hypothetical protein